MIDRTNLWKALGPGILVACAAVGGSHLVWSTRAGAEFGWSLLWLVLLANALKFPFFLYGQRYTAATGESLLAGYKRLGIAYVWIFLAVNILTGTINIAGVGMLSGALLTGYGITGISVPWITVGVLVVCAGMLLVGHYKLLDTLAKVIIALLGISTVVAVALAIPNRPELAADFVAPSPYQWASFAFLISLLGWMPAPIDLSAWSSLWMFSREKQTGHFATVKESAIDFYLGYFSAVVLAILFVALGALVMYGTTESFAAGGVGFSQQLVSLYTDTIGEWSHLLILSAAFITMFSTTLTCLDGYPRSLAACCVLIQDLSAQKFIRIQNLWILVSTGLASLVVLAFVQNLLQLLSFAAIISFITSPVLAYINFRVMNGANVPEAYRPGLALKALSWAGLLFFTVMTAGYLYVTFVR
ncbi:Nramp family divalent metal transporter [Coraliomargarita algicola]|uniref:Nramp family divalent metal transporter n=1 Tax=Coraliomargarita algicola TaxID=3092156 RepID=A0ABZ0RTT8_9BACT|nr:Nramp family divalent metal transporter [Coraliomargarita sp. J2-16]WPJ96379.1 Nramp family divalent metal transporter [Coraliomargarita sp. J2-16]